MAMAGVSYTVGRENNQQYHETYNGIQMRDKHQFPGRGGSLYHSRQTGELDCFGEFNPADLPKRVQEIKKCRHIISGYASRIVFPIGLKLHGRQDYDSTHYDLLLRYIQNKKSEKPGGRTIEY